ncbi:GNAT family N-acetyltransferase [Legionella erythra]|uniref:Putative N-acetyltransferase n=1 Tax=Legionella erythra TaxID=448 RepID=A0A0W0TJC1_LEGER|nr:GNAT family protein [Legionella erythra]KTC95686.1 putative N-acetyltransferase [Legionella erythra]
MPNQLVTLRPPLPEDSKSYFNWINDRELVLHNADFKPVSWQEHERWFNHLNELPTSLFFSIVENATQLLIGSCSLRNIDTQQAELQIRIGEPHFHGKGYGTAAVRLLVAHGFSKLKLECIYLHVFCRNVRAIKAYEKCHFKIDSKLEKAAFIDNQYIDMFRMSVNRDLIQKL